MWRDEVKDICFLVAVENVGIGDFVFFLVEFGEINEGMLWKDYVFLKYRCM